MKNETQHGAALQAIDAWRERSFHPGKTREEYMVMMSERAKTFCGVVIDTKDPVSFVIRMRGVIAFAKSLSQEIGEEI